MPRGLGGVFLSWIAFHLRVDSYFTGSAERDGTYARTPLMNVKCGFWAPWLCPESIKRIERGRLFRVPLAPEPLVIAVAAWRHVGRGGVSRITHLVYPSAAAPDGASPARAQSVGNAASAIATLVVLRMMHLHCALDNTRRLAAKVPFHNPRLPAPWFSADEHHLALLPSTGRPLPRFSP